MAGEINSNLPIGTSHVAGPARAVGASQAGAAEGTSFKDMLVKSLEEVNKLQEDANVAYARLAAGKTENVTEVLNAVQKASVAFEMLMQIRNKLVDAYDEIKQMRI
jgi:flagellar hook-basal body complex protein FliE